MSKISKQTLFLAAVPLGFLLLVLCLALVVQQRNAQIASESQRATQVLSDADRAVMLVTQASRTIATFEQTRSQRDLATSQAVLGQLQSALADMRSNESKDPRSSAAAVRLAADFRQAITILERYLKSVEANDVAEARRITATPQVRALNIEIPAQLAVYESAQRISSSASIREVRNQIQSFTRALIVIALAGVLLTVMLSVRFGLAITRRILLLTENAKRLAEGASTELIAGEDEISELDRVYREMTRRIQSEQRRVAALQHALLPQELPVFPGIRLDASYVPAAGEAEIGGDWYDVFQISDRRIGISIGDVAGHGLRAAAIMANARHAIRTTAYFTDSPSDVLSRVNEVLRRNEGGSLVTAFYATLDLFDGTLAYSFAGHPAPLVVRTGRPVEHLPGSGFVLGVESRTEYASYATQLEIGSALILYTDGVIEREGEYFEGVRDLEQAVEDEYREASQNIAHAIQTRMLRRGPSRDDSAVLFIGVTALGPAGLPAGHAVWTIDAKSERSARRVKRALLWHLGQLAGEGADLSVPELILSEMLGNVARHTPGPAEVVLEWTNDSATIKVTDRGPQFEPPGASKAADLLAENGRGIFLLRAMSREFTVSWTGAGNCVTAVLPLKIDYPSAVSRAVA